MKVHQANLVSGCTIHITQGELELVAAGRAQSQRHRRVLKVSQLHAPANILSAQVATLVVRGFLGMVCMRRAGESDERLPGSVLGRVCLG